MLLALGLALPLLGLEHALLLLLLLRLLLDPAMALDDEVWPARVGREV